MSLPDRDPRLYVRRKADVADLDRLDSDAAQNEFSVDGLADADVDDFDFGLEAVAVLPLVRLVGLMRDVGVRYRFGELATSAD